MSTTTFEDAEEGDKVYSPTFGWGEIRYIHRDTNHVKEYPVDVRFFSRYGEDHSFTFKGYYYVDVPIQSLFWDEVAITAPIKQKETYL
jgi:hypothetical protein